MKKFLLSSLLSISYLLHPHKLTNQTLKTMDQKGFFDKHIIDILQVRQKIKDFIHGKSIWQGVQLSLKTSSNITCKAIFKRPEMLYGVTFIIIDPLHPNLSSIVTPDNKQAVQSYLKKINSLSYLQRQELKTNEGCFTGSYAFHPITNEKLPIYLADYAINNFDMRSTQVHMAVPAHNNQDFTFAQKYHLPVKVVVTGQDHDPAEDLPKFNKQKNKLLEAYTREDNLCKIINSDFLNGSIKQATEAINKFIDHHNIQQLKQPILYHFNNADCSLEALQQLEKSLSNINLSSKQHEELMILMNYAQADFLDIVEHFLLGVLSIKTILIDLIEESCKLRDNKNCYFLKWSQLGESSDTVRTTFKRDIVTLNELFTFCSDLVNFLSDLASSCPHALENLKKLTK